MKWFEYIYALKTHVSVILVTNEDGVNSITASINGAQIAWNASLGDDSQTYEGIYEIGLGKSALVWTKTNRRSKSGDAARVFGNSIVLTNGYFVNRSTGGLKDEISKQKLFLHESIHIHQQLKYGTGGQFVKFAQRINDPNPSQACNQPGRIVACSALERAIESYNGGRTGTDLNPLEIEAEIEELLFN